MNKVIKSYIKEVCPPFFIGQLKKISDALKLLFMDNYLKKSFKRNSEFKNVHKGKRCFIIATGPSIASQNLLPLKNELCISVSQFYLHPGFSEIKPFYHIHAPNHPPFDSEDINKLATSEEIAFKNHGPICFYGHRNYNYSFFNVLKKTNKLNNRKINFVKQYRSSYCDRCY